MTKCPQCGSTQFLIAEDITYSYQCSQREGYFVGIPYAITEDKAKNTRLRCSRCSHEIEIPEKSKIVWY